MKSLALFQYAVKWDNERARAQGSAAVNVTSVGFLLDLYHQRSWGNVVVINKLCVDACDEPKALGCRASDQRKSSLVLLLFSLCISLYAQAVCMPCCCLSCKTQFVAHSSITSRVIEFPTISVMVGSALEFNLSFPLIWKRCRANRIDGLESWDFWIWRGISYKHQGGDSQYLKVKEQNGQGLTVFSGPGKICHCQTLTV